MKSKTSIILRMSGLTILAFSLAISITLAGASHGGSGSPELQTVGNFNPFGGVDGLTTDVWAYGNYAYLGSFDEPFCSLDITGVRIIDISDPANPTQVGFIPTPPNTRANDVKVTHIETPFFSGEILIHSNEFCGNGFIPRLVSSGGVVAPGNNGIAIYDVTNPLNPKVLKQNFLNFQVHNTYIYQQGDQAYALVVDDENARDFHIVDITKPQAPVQIAVVGAPDWPGLRDNIGLGEVFLHDVWAQENNGKVIAYLSYWDAGLVLLDITNPSSPVFLGDSDYLNPDRLSGKPPEGNSHVAVPNAAGTRVLMGDEDFAAGILTKFEFNGTPYPAAQGLFTKVVDPSFSGPIHWTGGEGCTTGEFDRTANPGEVALVQRGTCFFSEKAANAQALGYAGFVVANDAARGDALVAMSAGTDDVITIPGFFVGFSTGEIMKANEGGLLDVEGVFDGYGYLRLLDVTNPANIKELAGFATEGVFVNPPLPGDHTMHNVVVEGTTAYISWYGEGMRVVSFKKDKLKEVAHFVDTGPAGSNFWGVYLHHHPNGNTYILGSDRDTGLWIFDTP
ncbi:MAG TPA: PA domain-containing protein [Anaerolineales bacterium]|nr:PA domain-containing protein [Anaerolineales bacterium]